MKNLLRNLLLVIPFLFAGSVSLSQNALSNTAKQSANKIDNKQPVNNELNQKVKEMYTQFLSLLADTNLTNDEITEFFNKYFDKQYISYLFTGNKAEQSDLYEILKEYFKYLLTGNILSQVKNYELSGDTIQMTKKYTTILKCKLQNKNDKKDTIDMSIAFANSNLIKDLCFMGSVFVIKGAKNIVELYCQEKGNNYRKAHVNEKLKIVKSALTEYMNNSQQQKK